MKTPEEGTLLHTTPFYQTCGPFALDDNDVFIAWFCYFFLSSCVNSILVTMQPISDDTKSLCRCRQVRKDPLTVKKFFLIQQTCATCACQGEARVFMFIL